MSPAARRLVVTLAAAVVALSLAPGAARVTWLALGIEPATPLGAPATPVVPRASAASAPDLAPVLALAPFGTVPVAAPASEPVRETALDLVLHGVMLAVPAERSVAYISGRDLDPTGFGVGEPVTGDAVLSAVHRDRVILSRDGREEVLAFPSGEAAPDASASAIRERILANQGQALPAADSAPDEAIDFWRRRIAENPKAVMDQLGVETTAEGYRIAEGASAAVRRAGFRAGDVVARVNGEAVGDVERDRDLFERVAASGRVRVELIREGRRIALSFPLR